MYNTLEIVSDKYGSHKDISKVLKKLQLKHEIEITGCQSILISDCLIITVLIYKIIPDLCTKL